MISCEAIGLILSVLAGNAAAQQTPRSNPAAELVSIAIRGPVQPVLAHGKFILAYEVDVMNVATRSAALTRLEAFAGDGSALLTYGKADLERNGRQFVPKVAALRLPLQAAARAIIFCWIEAPAGARPSALRHRLTYSILPGKEQAVEVATPVVDASPVVLGPPVTSGEWWAVNGPSNSSEHRRAQVRIDGNPDAPFAQRYAIDWVRLCDGRWMQNQGRENTDYCGYGADVLAVADAWVAAVKDTIPENKPGENSRSVQMTKETLLGNYVILDLGEQKYAVYAHLQQGSIQVKPGTQVRRGQVLARLGNSGNSDAPHLHFHVAQGPSIESIVSVQTNPIPYVIDRFEWRGVYRGKGAAAAKASVIRSLEIPLDGDIVRFLP
ncbi:MAG: M23 family metallopeptidase [Acidobacteriota bacterium]|jgi:murein DD-endopeptidase MepM/ murein hydrolase activator NlpD